MFELSEIRNQSFNPSSNASKVSCKREYSEFEKSAITSVFNMLLAMLS